MVDISLKARLELLRGSKTQKEFAEWLGESVTTVGSYFTEFRRPGIEFLHSLAQKGVNLNWFVTGVGPVYVDTDRESTELPPEAQVFLMELIQEGTPKEMLPEIMKYLKDKMEYQRHTNATEEQIRIGLHIVKEQAKKKRTGK